MPKGNYRRTCRIRRASEAMAAKARLAQESAPRMVQCVCCDAFIERRASFEYHGSAMRLCASCSPMAALLLQVFAFHTGVQS